MSKEQTIINYYVMCNKLKNTIRTGWRLWNLQRARIESVAEHIFGTQMLAIAIHSEYQYDVDIMKVIFMLAVHELGEAIIGDLVSFEISKPEKIKIEHAAVHQILDGLFNQEQIEQLFLEYDARTTKEAIFAHQCDKLEADLQCKLYDEEGCVTLGTQEDNCVLRDPKVQELLKTTTSWSTAFLQFTQQTVHYDDNFTAISNYAMNHQISKEK